MPLDSLEKEWDAFIAPHFGRKVPQERKLTLFNPGGGEVLPQLHANAYTRKKSMGGNSDNFCIFLNVYQVR